LRLKLHVSGLQESYAVLPGIRQVSKTRLHEFVAHASNTKVDRLGAALAAYLGG